MIRAPYDPRVGRLSESEAALIVALRRVIVERVTVEYQGDGEDAEEQVVTGLRGMIADATEDYRQDAVDAALRRTG